MISQQLIMEIDFASDAADSLAITAYVEQVGSNKRQEIEDIPAAQWQIPENLSPLLADFARGIKPSDLEQVGKYLYSVLFPQVENHPLTEFLHTIISDWDENPTRLVLRIRNATLSRLPWEAMYDGKRLLSIQSKLPLVRQLVQLDIQSFRALRKIHVLLVTASPTDLTPLLAEQSFDNIIQQVHSEASNGWRNRLGLGRQIEFDELIDANEISLQEKLQSKIYHVVCFAVHGSDNNIALAHPRSGKKQIITAPELADWFSTASQEKVRLVMFVACATDTVQSMEAQNDPLAGFARAFMDNTDSKIPAVVAMQSDININRADLFTTTFFRGIGSFQPVDMALTQARRSLQLKGRINRDVVSPVLYLQSQDSRLFVRDPLPMMIGAVVSIVIIGLLLLTGLTELNRIREGILSQEAIARENEARINQLAHLGQFETLYLDAMPSRPLITTDTLWFTTSDGNLHRHPILTLFDNDTVGIFDVGAEPSAPVTDGQNVWVSSRADGILTRIPLGANSTPRSEFIAFELEAPIVTASGIWLYSYFESRLFHVDQDWVVTDYEMPLRVWEPFVIGDTLWIIPRNGGDTLLVNTQTLNVNILKMDHIVTAVHAGQNTLWLLDDQNTLTLYSSTGEKKNHISPNAAIQAYDGNGELLYFSTDMGHIYQWWLDEDEPTLFKRVGDHISALRLIDDYLFLLIEKNLILYDHIGNRKSQLEVGSISTLAELVQTPLSFWLPLSRSHTVLQIERQTGQEIQRLEVCDLPQATVYDGASLWITCAQDQNLVFGPESILYLDNRSQHDTLYSHTPLEAYDLLWIVPQGSGDVVAFNAHEARVADVFATDGTLLPLQLDLDSHAIWTAQVGANPSTVWRLTMESQTSFGRSLAGLPDEQFIRGVSQTIPGDIQSFYLIDDYVWVVHNEIESLNNSPNVTILDRRTLRIVRQTQFDIAVTGIVKFNNRIWLSASGLNKGVIYQIDPRSLDVLQEYTPDNTQFAPLAAVPIGSRLYFPFVTITFNQIDELTRTIIDPESLQLLQGYLHVFDLETGTWGEPLDIAPLTFYPVVDNTQLWFVLTVIPTVGVPKENEFGSMYLVDTETGLKRDFSTLCASVLPPYIMENLVIVECSSPQYTLKMLSPDGEHILQSFENIGGDVQPPLEVDGIVYVAFYDSDIIAMFDSFTGDLLRIRRVGNDPTALIVLEGHVHVYNAASGTLQLISD